VTTDSVTGNRAHDAQTRLTNVGCATLTFDPSGNMTTDESGREYQHDARNRLMKFNRTTFYRFDALGRRNRELYDQINNIVRNL
jgi:hypothetical protein